jgi:hypothetical protein
LVSIKNEDQAKFIRGVKKFKNENKWSCH